MKDLIKLATYNDTRDYVESLWRTDEFRVSPWIAEIVDRFAAIPRVFYTMDDQRIESSHFTTWFNLIARRDYVNDALSDLYYLHEIYHAVDMAKPGWYKPGLPWNRWFTKQAKNEFEASMASEVVVHFEVPGVRDAAFPFDIWADRFLQDEFRQTLWTMIKNSSTRAAEPEFWKTIRDERVRVMTSPSPFDILELQIANYLSQNQDWARVWFNRYDLVETHMAEFMQRVDDSYDCGPILDWHIAWAESYMTKCLPQAYRNHPKWSQIPFLDEAIVFSEVYHANKAKFGNEVVMGPA